MATFLDIVRVQKDEDNALHVAELDMMLMRAVCDGRRAQMTPALADQRDGRISRHLLYLTLFFAYSLCIFTSVTVSFPKTFAVSHLYS